MQGHADGSAWDVRLGVRVSERLKTEQMRRSLVLAAGARARRRVEQQEGIFHYGQVFGGEADGAAALDDELFRLPALWALQVFAVVNRSHGVLSLL